MQAKKKRQHARGEVTELASETANAPSRTHPFSTGSLRKFG